MSQLLLSLRRSALTQLSLGQWIIVLLMSVITLPVVLPYFWMLFVSLTSGVTGSVDTHSLSAIMTAFIPLMLVFFTIQFLIDHQPLRIMLSISVIVTFMVLAYARTGEAISLYSYRFLFEENTLPSVYASLWNSFLLAGGQTLLVCIAATGAGYYLSRFNFRGRSGYMKALVILHAFPALTLIIPIFLLLYWSNLLDSLTGVILVIAALELPFAIFLMKGFFDSVPWDIEMSAMTDGASRIQAFFSVVLPQVKNGIIAIGVFSFLKGWEEYVFVTSFIFDSQHWVMSQFLYFFAEDSMGADYGLLTAVAVIYLLPSLILYITCQKYLSQISVGGTKG
ncbi:carbohydrate ABC transporter permease [Photobacterium makurazakiensis]|uniref:carbohydrate ABC transporter permease n=1 Tax=Photobacterium makurazakiensis TaxID=2910234 RepID=UPI003D0C7F71